MIPYIPIILQAKDIDNTLYIDVHNNINKQQYDYGKQHHPSAQSPYRNNITACLGKEHKKAVTSPFEWLRQYYSSILGSEVTMRQTLRYLHAQVAFVMAAFFTYESLLVHAAVFVWFIVTLVIAAPHHSPDDELSDAQGK